MRHGRGEGVGDGGGGGKVTKQGRFEVGTRRINMRLHHGLSPEQLMSNAKKVVKTMRAKKRRLRLIAMKAARRRAANKLAAHS